MRARTMRHLSLQAQRIQNLETRSELLKKLTVSCACPQMVSTGVIGSFWFARNLKIEKNRSFHVSQKTVGSCRLWFMVSVRCIPHTTHNTLIRSNEELTVFKFIFIIFGSSYTEGRLSLQPWVSRCARDSRHLHGWAQGFRCMSVTSLQF